MNENEKEKDDGATDIILPIICPHCEKEVQLSVTFKLLPPTPTAVEEKNKSNAITEEN